MLLDVQDSRPKIPVHDDEASLESFVFSSYGRSCASGSGYLFFLVILHPSQIPYL